MDRLTAMEITSVSVVVAVVIGGIEALGMVGDLFGLAARSGKPSPRPTSISR
jgi:high-affinity nickel permease